MPKKSISRKSAKKGVISKKFPAKTSPAKTPPVKTAPAKTAKKNSVGKVSGKATQSAKVVAKAPSAAKLATKTAAVQGAKSSTAPSKPPSPEKPEVSLGRPLVTQEEKLFMLFHDDYLARQVFEFLRVETVKELEEFSQLQIIHMMTKPLRTTVDRIRQRLAQFKRSLKDDEQFAAEYRKQSGKS